jgi:hypothetical protein
VGTGQHLRSADPLQSLRWRLRDHLVAAEIDRAVKAGCAKLTNDPTHDRVGRPCSAVPAAGARSNGTTPRPQIALFRSANELRGIEIDGGSQVDLR